MLPLTGSDCGWMDAPTTTTDVAFSVCQARVTGVLWSGTNDGVAVKKSIFTPGATVTVTVEVTLLPSLLEAVRV